MRATHILYAIGLVLSCLTFVLPAHSEDDGGDQTAQNLKCLQEWAFPECNEGFSLCTTLGAVCYYCPTAADQKVRNCRVVEETSTCKIKINPHISANCGEKMKGTCVNNHTGGMTCQAVSVGHCGHADDRCS